MTLSPFSWAFHLQRQTHGAGRAAGGLFVLIAGDVLFATVINGYDEVVVIAMAHQELAALRR